ncbi:alpha-galactosidase [Brevundimonas sp. LM2]|uniref:NPCBM/NEW2 domain-containing protein n=1 Tax=Brevundimonas sp. LM2 TaxID=1938605 RepID=UPI0009838F01|nr:NPCBM/NEW2 domain-containing protein [Brevundimonas sp. LM2]AQR63325.1 alpha-galactosidase [Brevundimonas sp. LM2]
MRPLPNRVGPSLRRRFVALAAGLALLTPGVAAAQTDPLAPTGRWSANTRGAAPVPPMGWNSWNAFYSDIDEEKIMASATILVDTGLAARGYRHVNIDDGWWLKRRQSDGRMVIRTDNFPSAIVGPGDQTSFRPLTDRLHAMGLRAGIYSDIGRNSCGQVYTPNFANQPEGTVAEREVGLHGHVDQDIRLYFAEWGFDLIKVDGCGIRGLAADTDHVRQDHYREFPPLIDMNALGRTDIAAVQALYEEVGQALHDHNPDGDYLFSVCLWGSSNVRAWGKNLGNLSRTSDDITPQWTRMLTNLDTVSTRALYAGPGSWNDPDMLFVGSGDFDAAHMTEARSHFALWAILNAPLIIGYDLRKATPEQIALFGNPGLVALNQDPAGHQAVPAYQSSELQIFVKTLADGDKGVAIFNRGLAAIETQLSARHLKFRDDAEVSLTDLWTGERQTFTGETAFRLEPRQTLVFRASGARALPDGLYVSEVPGDVNPAEDGVTTPQHDPAIHRGVIGWQGTRGSGEHPQYGGFGGAQADRSPFGEPLRIAGTRFDSGIGALANSRLEVRNHGYARLTARVGIDDSAVSRERPVTFLIYGDGRLLARSEPQAFGAAPQALDVDIRDVAILEMVVRAEGEAVAALPVVWGDAALLR